MRPRDPLSVEFLDYQKRLRRLGLRPRTDVVRDRRATKRIGNRHALGLRSHAGRGLGRARGTQPRRGPRRRTAIRRAPCGSWSASWRRRARPTSRRGPSPTGSGRCWASAMPSWRTRPGRRRDARDPRTCWRSRPTATTCCSARTSSRSTRCCTRARASSSRDIAPISLISKYYYGMALCECRSRRNTFEEFVQYAKAHPGEVSYATLGAGSAQEIMARQLEKLAASR